MAVNQMSRGLFIGLVVVLISGHPVEAAGKPFPVIDSWENFYRANREECWPPFVRLRKPIVHRVGKTIHRLEGTRLVQKKGGSRTTVRIGVLSAPKDSSLLTVGNIEHFVKEFRNQDVDWIIINGDVGYTSSNIQKVLEPVVKVGIPVLLTMGNGETITDFNDAVAPLMEKYPHVYNMNFTRFVDTPTITFISVPGYYDRRYIYSEDGCYYGPKSLKRLEEIFRRRKGRDIVLVSHGPPKGMGEDAIDQIYTSESVGDPALSSLMRKYGVRFGIFGHILEAGGRAVNLKQSSIEGEQWSSSLLVNAGSVSAIPWRLLDGTLSYGMAMLVTIEKGKIKYSLLKSDLHSIIGSGEDR